MKKILLVLLSFGIVFSANAELRYQRNVKKAIKIKKDHNQKGGALFNDGRTKRNHQPLLRQVARPEIKGVKVGSEQEIISDKSSGILNKYSKNNTFMPTGLEKNLQKKNKPKVPLYMQEGSSGEY